MVKYYEEGTEQVLLALTFLGVLYLVYLNQPYKLGASKKDGLTNLSAGVLGYNVEMDAANQAGYYPNTFGREGFSLGSMEPPVFSTTPFDENDFMPAAYEQSSAGVDYSDAPKWAKWSSHRNIDQTDWSQLLKQKYADQWEGPQHPITPPSNLVSQGSTTEGLRGYAAVRQSFTDNDMLGAARGRNVTMAR